MVTGRNYLELKGFTVSVASMPAEETFGAVIIQYGGKVTEGSEPSEMKFLITQVK